MPYLNHHAVSSSYFGTRLVYDRVRRLCLVIV